MPVIRKLSPQEIQSLKHLGSSLHAITDEQYDQILADFAPGEYGEVLLSPKENSSSVARRLKEAGERCKLIVTFLDTEGDALRFAVRMDDGHSGRLPEEVRLIYSQLRGEILHRDTINIQTLGAATVFVGALMGFAFSDKVVSLLVKSTLFIFGEIVAIIGLYLHLERRRGMYLLSSYLRVFIEQDSKDLRWETRIAQLRIEKPRFTRGSPHQWSYIIIIFINFLFSVDYAIKMQIPSVLPLNLLGFGDLNEYIPIALISVQVLVFICAFYLVRKHDKYRQRELFDGMWKQVKSEEEKSKHPKS